MRNLQILITRNLPILAIKYQTTISERIQKKKISQTWTGDYQWIA